MAIRSTHMGLMKWTALSDRFDYKELADNFERIDIHDHTLGKGLQIPEDGIAPDAITPSKIANNAVTDQKLQSSDTSDLERAVSANHIKTNAVVTAKIANGAVTPEKVSGDILGGLNEAIEAGIARVQALFPPDTTPPGPAPGAPPGTSQAGWQNAMGEGGAFNLSYLYDSSTTNSNPGIGQLRLNSTNMVNVTNIYIHARPLSNESSIRNITNTLSSIYGVDKSPTIQINIDGNYGSYKITSYDSYSSYFALTVQYQAGSGNLSLLQLGSRMDVSLYSRGLANGWSGLARYYLDITGRVYIQMGKPGEPASGPWNVDAFQLPEGYRPNDSVWVPSYPGMLRIYPDGRVRPIKNEFGIEYRGPQPGEAERFLASGSFRVA